MLQDWLAVNVEHRFREFLREITHARSAAGGEKDRFVHEVRAKKHPRSGGLQTAGVSSLGSGGCQPAAVGSLPTAFRISGTSLMAHLGKAAEMSRLAACAT